MLVATDYLVPLSQEELLNAAEAAGHLSQEIAAKEEAFAEVKTAHKKQFRME